MVSPITLYLKEEPNSQTLNLLSRLNLETSHLAIVAAFPWRPNERRMEEYANAVHILPACELDPVMVAVASLAGTKSGSQCVRLTMGENRTCLKLFELPTPASSLKC